MNIILGNGVSSLIIAACLNYYNQPFTICSDSDMTMPQIMLLKYDSLDELKLYFDIFGIAYNEENVKEYCKSIKVGYLYKGKIYDKLTDEMKKSYLQKQNRENTSTALSDNTQNFNAILLHKVAIKLKNDFTEKVKRKCRTKNCNVFDTNQTRIFNKNVYELYIVKKCEIDLKDYDYIYDCDSDSPIKRYSKDCTEYIYKPSKQYIAIWNYYDSPKIYDEYDVNTNKHHIYIGRYATQTQFKQKDIIKFMLKILKRR